MTVKTISALIRRLNNKKTNGQIFLRPLLKEVDYAKVWSKRPTPTSTIAWSDDDPFQFYFIKNADGVYVGAVFDMRNDLHWYVLPKFRKQGHLIRNLKSVIIPHILQRREDLVITIDIKQIGVRNFQASEKVALAVGFVKTENEKGEITYILSKTLYENIDYVSGMNATISQERILELKKLIYFASRTVLLVQNEVEQSLGNLDYADELKELSDQIRAQVLKLEDTWSDCKGK